MPGSYYVAISYLLVVLFKFNVDVLKTNKIYYCKNTTRVIYNARRHLTCVSLIRSATLNINVEHCRIHPSLRRSGSTNREFRAIREKGSFTAAGRNNLTGKKFTIFVR